MNLFKAYPFILAFVLVSNAQAVEKSAAEVDEWLVEVSPPVAINESKEVTGVATEKWINWSFGNQFPIRLPIKLEQRVFSSKIKKSLVIEGDSLFKCTLIVARKEVETDHGHFQIEIELQEKVQQSLQMHCVNNLGDLLSQQISFKVLPPQSVLAAREARKNLPPLPKTLKMTTILSYSSVHYYEEGIGDYYLKLLTPKFLVDYSPYQSKWTYQANFYFTWLNLGIQIPAADTNQTHLYFYGANARAGYRFFYEPRSRWRFTLLSGLSFSRMLSTGSSIGYSYLVNTQFNPSVAYKTGKDTWVSAYLKFVPFSFDLSQNETAIGAQYFIDNGKESIGVYVDYSSLTKTLTFQHQVQSLSIGLGYGWR